MPFPLPISPATREAPEGKDRDFFTPRASLVPDATVNSPLPFLCLASGFLCSKLLHGGAAGGHLIHSQRVEEDSGILML